MQVSDLSAGSLVSNLEMKTKIIQALLSASASEPGLQEPHTHTQIKTCFQEFVVQITPLKSTLLIKGKKKWFSEGGSVESIQQ